MKAIITGNNSNAYNYARDKELVSAFSVIGKLNGELCEVVCCRSYMGRSANSSIVYSSIWVHGDKHCSGKGSAGGYGYHKESAAIQAAITNAGIELFGPVYRADYTPAQKRKAMKTRTYIDGVGDDAIRDSLESIAKAAGAKGKLLIVRH